MTRKIFTQQTSLKQSVPFFLCLLVLMCSVLAQGPSVFSDYYGTVYINGNPASAGTLVVAYDTYHNECGAFVVKDVGRFGYLSCSQQQVHAGEALFNSPETGDSITFTLNGAEARVVGSSEWVPGSAQKIRLVLDSAPITQLVIESPKEKQDWSGVARYAIPACAVFGVLIIIYVVRRKRRL